jgi:hypothetical protein
MAKLQLENTNLVIVGSWNVAIITPQWIQTQFQRFNTEGDIPFEIGINIRDIRYDIKNININPRPDRLILSPKIETNDCFSDLIELSKGIISILSHTPIIAVGSNFAYVLNKEEKVLPVGCETEKIEEYYNKIGRKFSGQFVTQHIITEKDKQLTIIYNISPSSKMVSFNFHKSASKLDSIVDFIGDFINQFEEAKRILHKILKG